MPNKNNSSYNELVEKLKDGKSSSRRSAAKKIRKISNPLFCKYLIEALKLEVLKNTWETQYHLAMALGSSSCPKYLNDLYYILEHRPVEPMVKLALADSITRLEKNSNLLCKALESKDLPIVEGCIRAIALEHRKIPEKTITDLINFLDNLKNNNSKFWILAATPGNQNEALLSYAQKMTSSENVELKKAAEAALEGKYINWKIL